MPKPISRTKKKPVKTSKRDANQSAFAAIQKTIELSEAGEPVPEPDKATISALMAAIGRKGGKIGGKRRLETMSQEQRSRAAYEAAKARWSKKP